MAYTAWYCTALTGGAAGAVDAIDGSNVTNGDPCFCIASNVAYTYIVDTSGAAAENSPFIIVPDTNPGNINFELANISRRPLVAKTADYTVTAIELLNNVIYTNDAAGAAVNLTLPAGNVGYMMTAIVTDAQYLKMTANGTETFQFEATAGAAGGYIRSNTVGDSVTIKWTGDDWLIVEITGSWSYDE